MSNFNSNNHWRSIDKETYESSKRNNNGWNDQRDDGKNRNSRWNDRNKDTFGRSGSWSNRSSNWETRIVEKVEQNPPVEFEKNFYEEKVRNKHIMDEKDIQDFRISNQMKINGNDVPPPIKSFDDIDFAPNVTEYFMKKGFVKPMAIQAQGWTMALAGRDMVGIAETGSGKTISFALPALVHAAAQSALRPGDGPIVLVLAPTRELCLQIQEVVQEYDRFFKLQSTAIYGGVSAFPQKQALRRGVEILVATPGRLIDLMEQGSAKLGRVTFLVLDEADRMLDMGFEPQLRQIIPKTNPKRQTLMWSATWPREVRDLAYSFMNDYIQVTIGEDELTSNKKIHQVVKMMDERDKVDNLLEFLTNNHKKLIIFCNKKKTCDYLEYELSRKKHRAAAIHGDKSQNIRDRVISDFKCGTRNILIATDVAARGLDVKDVEAVINFDFPPNCESYIHRIGRTARGNQREGLAIAFFTREDRGNASELVNILKNANQPIPDELSQIAPRSSSYRSSTNRFSRRSYSHPRRW